MNFRISSQLVFTGLCFTLVAFPTRAMGILEILELTFRGNPQLESQARLIESTQMDVRSAYWQFYPTFSTSVEQVNAPDSDPAYSNSDGRVTVFRLQQPLWTAGRLSAGLNKSEASLLIAQAQFEETRQQLALRAVAAWGEWKTGEQRSFALQESLQTHLRLSELIRRRVAEGVSATADLVLATSRYEQVQVELMLAKAQQANAIARFEQLIGRSLEDRFLQGVVVKPGRPILDLAHYLQQSWAVSPVAVKFQAQIRQQELEVEIRRAQLFPELYVRVEHQLGSYTTMAPSSSNRVFFGLTATPGAGLSAKTGIDSAALRVRALREELESNRRSLNEQVTLEHISVMMQSQRVQGLRASVISTRDMFDSWDRQFLAGRKTWVEVMNAARELAQVQTALAEAESSYTSATWRLKILSEGIPNLMSSDRPIHRPDSR